MKLSTSVLVVSLASAMAACADDSMLKDPKRSSESEIIVGIDDLSDKVKVNDDSLEFDASVASKLRPYLDKLDAYVAATDKTDVEPVFLVGNRQSDAKGGDGAIKDGIRNPEGYLRRAVSWSAGVDGKIVVKTEHATIAEASGEIFSGRIASLKTSQLRILSGTDTEAATDTGGETKSWSYTFGGSDGFRAIDLSGTTLFEKSISAGKAKVVLSKGTLDLKPTIDADLAMSGKIPTSGKAVITTDFAGALQIDTSADGSFDLSTGDSLFSKKFAGMLVGPGVGLPVTMHVDVNWQCGIGTNGKTQATIGAKVSGRITAGAQFEGTDLHAIFPEPTYELEKIGPSLDTSAGLHGDCHLISKVAIQVFDAAGPNATVDLYAKANVTAKDSTSDATDGNELDTSLTFGVQATVGGQLAPFGYMIAEVHSPPLTFEKTFNGTVTVGL